MHGILRRVKLDHASTCSCGRVLDNVDVREWQPSPVAGTYTMCPTCLKIYVLGDDMCPANVRERDIPQHILEARDSIMSAIARQYGGAKKVAGNT